MNQDKIIRQAEATARWLREEMSRGNKNPLYEDAHGSIMALLGVLGERTDAQDPQRVAVPAGSITITHSWDQYGWIKGTVMGGLPDIPWGYSFEAKVYDTPSKRYGIYGGHVSKLEIRRDEPVRRCVLHYDRGWDIEPVDHADRAVFWRVKNYLDAMAQMGGEDQ